MDWLRKKKSWRKNNDIIFKTSDLETVIERRKRWRSIRIVYFTMFMMSLGFSIILTGVWPFLDKLDPSAGKEFLGFVVAANPLGQILFSPLFGYWGNKSGSIRAPMLCSLTLFILASAGYSLLEAFPSSTVKYWMVFMRFIVGVSSANISVCRSYISAATTLSERTGAVSMISLAQVLGFVVGPGIQAIVTPLGDKGVSIFGGSVSLNMYTTVGWVNVFLCFANLLLYLPWIFSEQHIATREAMRDQGAASEKDTWSGTKPDYIAAWSLILAFFFLVFDFIFLETLATSLVMDQFAWTKEQALYYMGLLMSFGAVIAIFTFATIKPLCRWFDERSVLLYGGFVFMILGRLLDLPWSSTPPLLKITDDIVNGTEAVGCPVESQPWCAYIPAMTVPQLIIGYAVTSMGYPIGITLIQTLFSKILGPRPQGVWQGLITAFGCLSRILGPVFVSFVYVELGTIWTFSVSAVLMALCLIWLRLVYCRLVVPPPDPIHLEPQQENLIEMKFVTKKSDEAQNGELQNLHS